MQELNVHLAVSEAHRAKRKIIRENSDHPSVRLIPFASFCEEADCMLSPVMSKWGEMRSFDWIANSLNFLPICAAGS